MIPAAAEHIKVFGSEGDNPMTEKKISDYLDFYDLDDLKWQEIAVWINRNDVDLLNTDARVVILSAAIDNFLEIGDIDTQYLSNLRQLIIDNDEPSLNIFELYDSLREQRIIKISHTVVSLINNLKKKSGYVTPLRPKESVEIKNLTYVEKILPVEFNATLDDLRQITRSRNIINQLELLGFKIDDLETLSKEEFITKVTENLGQISSFTFPSFNVKIYMPLDQAYIRAKSKYDPRVISLRETGLVFEFVDLASVIVEDAQSLLLALNKSFTDTEVPSDWRKRVDLNFFNIPPRIKTAFNQLQIRDLNDLEKELKIAKSYDKSGLLVTPTGMRISNDIRESLRSLIAAQAGEL